MQTKDRLEKGVLGQLHFYNPSPESAGKSSWQTEDQCGEKVIVNDLFYRAG